MHGKERIGFSRPLAREQRARQRTALTLIATATLALSTLIAATAISIGIAKADGLATQGDSNGHLAVAIILGVFFVAMGALTALTAKLGVRGPRDR